MCFYSMRIANARGLEVRGNQVVQHKECNFFRVSTLRLNE